MDKEKKFNYEKLLTKRLLPEAVIELQNLIHDDDKKVRIQAIDMVLDMSGKRKRGQGGGGVTLNLGNLADTLIKIGSKKNESISTETSKKIATEGTICQRDDREREFPNGEEK